jgi:hypothetical protein
MSFKNKTPNEMLFAQASPDKVMPVVLIWRGIWKWIFDERSCSLDHRKILEEEILKWNDIIIFQKRLRLTKYGPTESDSNPTGQKGNVIDELDYQIRMMCKTLVDNEEGLWDYHKDTLRIHNIDYRKSIHCKFWFPEIPTDYAKGQANLEAAKRENPEDYLPNPT